MEEKYLSISEVSKILGVSWITAYRYVNMCRTCGEYRGICECSKQNFILESSNISRGIRSNRKISTEELRKFLERSSDNARDVIGRYQRKTRNASRRNIKKKDNLGNSEE